MRALFALLLLLSIAAVAAADAAPADAIVGDWLVDSRDAIIRIEADGSGDMRRYSGHIAWLKDGYYHAEDGPALDGKPLMDLNNPDPARRREPLLGLRLLWDLRYEGDHWIGGRVYNSDSGHIYDCSVRIIDSGHLKLHGYVLHIPLLGGSTTWTRITTLPQGAPPPLPSAHSG